MSIRGAVARPEGVDDLMDEVRAYERSRLPEHQKVALRFADAFVTDPTGLTAETRSQLLHHFSPQQVVELTFKLVYHSANKALVALDSHPPVDRDHLTEFHYDEHGALVLHRAA